MCVCCIVPNTLLWSIYLNNMHPSITLHVHSLIHTSWCMVCLCICDALCLCMFSVQVCMYMCVQWTDVYVIVYVCIVDRYVCMVHR